MNIFKHDQVGTSDSEPEGYGTYCETICPSTESVYQLRELQRLVEIRNGWASYLMSLLDRNCHYE